MVAAEERCCYISITQQPSDQNCKRAEHELETASTIRSLRPSSKAVWHTLQRYMPLLHQSVTMKTVAPDLPLISFSQPHNLCRSLCRAKLRQTAIVNDEPQIMILAKTNSMCSFTLVYLT